jgi:hypothetical protein
MAEAAASRAHSTTLARLHRSNSYWARAKFHSKFAKKRAELHAIGHHAHAAPMRSEPPHWNTPNEATDKALLS